MKELPIYQRILKYVCYALAGAIALGTLLDSLNNAIDLIGSHVTYIGSSLILFIWLIVEFSLRWFPVRWVAKGSREVRLQSLGGMPRFALVGAILLLWYPRVIDTYRNKPMNSGQESVPAPAASQPPLPMPTATPTPLPSPAPLRPASTPAQKPTRKQTKAAKTQVNKEEALRILHSQK